MGKRVCAFVWNFFDADARVMRECSALAETGCEVRLIALFNPDNPQCLREEDKNGFHITRVMKGRAKNGLLKRFSELAGIIHMIGAARRERYDAYHANDLNTLPQAYVCARMRLRKRNRRPIIYDSHEVQTSRMGYSGKLVYIIERFLIKRAAAVVNTNDTRADYTAELYGIKKPRVLHNYPAYVPYEWIAAGRRDMRSMLALAPDERILLYQGGMQPGRGLENLVQAARHFTDGVLVLLGDGKMRPALIRLAEAERLSDRVKFLPKVPYEQLFGFTVNAYLGFQVLNNTCFNHYSADSNKLFEYMMCGVPVIACRMPEIRRIVERERCGLIVDEESPEEIARAVNRLLADPALRDELCGNALNGVGNYLWENEKNGFIDIYSSIWEG